VTRYKITDREFETSLRDGHQYQVMVADELRALNFECTVPELVIRPTYAQRHQYHDNADVIVHVGARDVRLEVKSYNTRFTNDPRTLRYHNPVVTNHNSWHRYKVKPDAIVVVSRLPVPGHRGRGKLVVPIDTEPQWELEWLDNQYQQIRLPVYRVAREHLVGWGALVASLTALTRFTDPALKRRSERRRVGARS
jgi:hypothetical protein